MHATNGAKGIATNGARTLRTGLLALLYTRNKDATNGAKGIASMADCDDAAWTLVLPPRGARYVVEIHPDKSENGHAM